MSDLISRESAIDAVKFDITYAKAFNKETGEVTELFKETNATLEKVAERIRVLPATEQWIPFDISPLTEEEKAEHPEWSFIINGEIPEEGQRILVNVAYKGHEAVQFDTWGNDGDGCYLDSGYDIGTEVTAWMPLPEPYKGGAE